MPILAREIMTSRVLTLEDNAKVIDAIRLMVNHDFRHVPITRSNSIIGMVTALSTIKGIDKEGQQVLSGSVGGIMVGTGYVKASPNDYVGEVVRRMIDSNADAALVFDGDKVVGIITERDIVRKLPSQLFKQRRVFDIMSKNPKTLGPESTISDAIKSMATHEIRHLVITRGNRVMGILSIRDILRYVMKQLEAGRNIDQSYPITSLMSHNPVTIDPSASVTDAIDLMRRNNVSSLPVVEKGVLMGIITEKDLIREIKPYP
ncbi:MAG: CBS domain-containing protein [Vulcanisaeta sp.]|nr:CBS domain-containing protein [Vulcanisaeta sp.]